MAEKFYESMNLYADCKVDSTIFKKAFYDNADITKADKDILKDDVEKIILKYSLKEENINVSPDLAQTNLYTETSCTSFEHK